MKICILGNGLTGLTLAKALVNLGIYVDILSDHNEKNKDRIRTIGISKKNVEFFNKHILNIDKIIWNINKIEIFTESLKNEKVLDFKNHNKNLFYILKNFKLYDLLIKDLRKNKFIKFKKNKNYISLLKNDYRLVFNCDVKNLITKKYFYKKDVKNYKSFAYTTIINHKKKNDNNVATQIFMKNGPLAFLPLSKIETSVVYSARGEKNIDFKKFILENNTLYKINKIEKISYSKLRSSNLRNYYYKNIIAFGDMLHRLHPLAGQGFNMSLRDIQELINLIKFKFNHGLDIDKSICLEFEKKMKSKNYIFSNGIDFIYEYFNTESRFNLNFLSKLVKVAGNNKRMNKIFTKIADDGLII